MRVAVHAIGDFPELHVSGPEWEGIHVYAVAALQDFTTFLFRDPTAMGILHCQFADAAPQLVRGMREGNVNNIVLVLLRELGSIEHRVRVRSQTLVAGADDAQADDIDPREVVARLRALQRRQRPPERPLIPIDTASKFDPERKEVEGRGVVIHLTGKESDLLALLAENPGKCFAKAHCMTALYGGHDEPSDHKIIDVYIHKLRRKLSAVCGDFTPIETVWGQGYRFVSAVPESPVSA